MAEKATPFFEGEGNLGWTFIKPWAQKAAIGSKKVMIGQKKLHKSFSFVENIFKIKGGHKICQPMSQKIMFGQIVSHIFFLFYDLFYDPWLFYLLKWKESDEEKERTNKPLVKKLH
jgi:hypothetical protein